MARQRKPCADSLKESVDFPDPHGPTMPISRRDEGSGGIRRRPFEGLQGHADAQATRIIAFAM